MLGLSAKCFDHKIETFMIQKSAGFQRTPDRFFVNLKWSMNFSKQILTSTPKIIKNYFPILIKFSYFCLSHNFLFCLSAVDCPLTFA